MLYQANCYSDYVCNVGLAAEYTSILKDPKQWDFQEFKTWKSKSEPTGIIVQIQNQSLAGTNTNDTLISWRCGRRNPNNYEILENDVQYTAEICGS